jgi:hypothetical protein
MSWFRANRGGVAWLAFFALACQLLFSFGHVHLGKIDGGALGWAVAAVDDGDSSAAAPQSPPKNAPTVPGDFCAICANISLASALAVLLVALFVLPLGSFARILPRPVADAEPDAFRHLPFGARGPPHA